MKRITDFEKGRLYEKNEYNNNIYTTHIPVIQIPITNPHTGKTNLYGIANSLEDLLRYINTKPTWTKKKEDGQTYWAKTSLKAHVEVTKKDPTKPPEAPRQSNNADEYIHISKKEKSPDKANKQPSKEPRINHLKNKNKNNLKTLSKNLGIQPEKLLNTLILNTNETKDILRDIENIKDDFKALKQRENS